MAGQSVDCKTCKKSIKDEELIVCLCCGTSLHLSQNCTKFPQRSIEGLKLISMNVLLICNSCVSNNKRDAIFNETASRIQQENFLAQSNKMSDDLKALKDIQTELSTLRQEMKVLRQEMKPDDSLLEVKLSKGFETFSDAIKANLASVEEAVTRSNPANASAQRATRIADPCAIRIRGVEESDGLPLAGLAIGMDEDKKRLVHLEVDSAVVSIKRLGGYEAGRGSPRSILATLENQFSRDLVLKSVSKVKTYNKVLYVSPDLSISELELEKKVLKKRYNFITEENVPRKDLKIIKLKLFRKGENENWVEVPTQ